MAPSWAAAPPRKVSSASVNCFIILGSDRPCDPSPMLNVSRPSSTRVITAAESWGLDLVVLEVSAPGALITQCDWAGAVRGLCPLSPLLQEDEMLGSLVPHCLHCCFPRSSRSTLCGPCWVQDLTASVHPWLLDLLSPSLPLQTPSTCQPHTDSEGSCTMILSSFLPSTVCVPTRFKILE